MTAPPDPVRSLAAQERLGDLRATYDPKEDNRRARNWLVVLGLPGLVLLPFTVGFLVNGIGWAAGLGLVLTAGYLGAAGRILLRDVLPAYGRALYIYENGLVLVARGGTVACPWDAVRELRVSGVRDMASDEIAWHCELTREDGRRIALGAEISARQEAVELISAEVTDRLLPKYVARVDSGGTVRAGPFEVSRDGIAKDAETVPWAHVADVRIENGVVYVDRSDRPAGMTATAGQVPNAVAFTSLAEHLRKSGAPSEGIE